MHHKNYLWVAVLLLLISIMVSCGGDDKDKDYSQYSGSWNINTIQTGGANNALICGIESPVQATVSPEGNATFGPIGNGCGTIMRGAFSGKNLTLTGNNDIWRNNGISCCTGTITLTITFSDANRGAGSAILNNCPDQESLWCTLQVTMTK